MTRKIAVVPGDGIGPEVIDAGMKVLERINDEHNLGLDFVHFGWNADEYLRTGISMPPGAMEDIRDHYHRFGKTRLDAVEGALLAVRGLGGALDGLIRQVVEGARPRVAQPE